MTTPQESEPERLLREAREVIRDTAFVSRGQYEPAALAREEARVDDLLARLEPSTTTERRKSVSDEDSAVRELSRLEDDFFETFDRLGYVRIPGEFSEAAAAFGNVAKAARVLDALFDGEPGRWTLDGRVLTDDASTALLSLHDYLNDVERYRPQ